MRAILYLALAVLVGCADPTCYRRCDEMCNQRATTDRSDYKRQLNCVRCLDACTP